jgi:hypothetical protein
MARNTSGLNILRYYLWFVKENPANKVTYIIVNPSKRRPGREQSFRTCKWDVHVMHVSLRCFLGTLHNTSDKSF